MKKTKSTKAGIQAYQKVKEQSVSPLDKVLYVTEVAIRAAQGQDGERLKKVLLVLRNGLNFEKYPDIAIGLERLYVYCEQMVDDGDYREALRVLVTLKRSWLESERFSNPPMASEAEGDVPAGKS